MSNLSINSTQPTYTQPIPTEQIQSPISQAPIPQKPSLCQRIWTAYVNAVQKMVDALGRRCMILAVIIESILLEPWKVIKAGFLFPIGWKKQFNFHRLNPETLSAEQAKMKPILLIHGNYHNQSAWLSLAKKLKNAHVGPVYTINLPSGEITDRDCSILQQKITEIKAQYRRHTSEDIQLDIIGHSRGGFLAQETARLLAKQSATTQISCQGVLPGKVIALGSKIGSRDFVRVQSLDAGLSNRLYEINGSYDVSTRTDPSSVLPANERTVPAGHIGLLTSNKAHEQIVQWLKS